MAKKLLVVLDPGHYPNYNPGVSPGYFEGDRMYDLSLYEKAALESYGIEVILTRERSNDLAVYKRGQVAVNKGKGYDDVVFISNHSNAFDGKACGVIAFRSLYLPKSQKLGEKLVNAIVDVMRPTTKVTYSRGVATREGDYGDWYGVIRGSVSGAKSEAQAAKGPVTYSYLIEHGFHDHKAECNFINDSANLKKIAEAEAKVIAEYFGFTKKVENKAETPTTKKQLYRVRKSWTNASEQIGAYSNLNNAKAHALKNKGYKVFDGSGKCVFDPWTKAKTIDELAREVIAGKWGVGAARKAGLTNAGYNYEAVQKRVNELLK